MSLQSVRDFFAANAPDIDVLVLDQSTATVAEAAAGHGVPPEQIAKTLSLRVGDRVILIATSGTARLDNKKAKAAFGGKVKMLDFATKLKTLPGTRSAASACLASSQGWNSIAICQSRLTQRLYQRPGRQTPQCALRPSGWPR
jgi:hypothetical protein